MQAFIDAKLLRPEQAVLIRGSGVDTSSFRPSPETSALPVVMLASRMLWPKGVGELVQAARLLKKSGLDFRLVLVGVPDHDNPTSISDQQLQDWHDEGIAEWWGLRRDMPQVLAQASIVALPTYYPEGVPKILLEAAASGRPIVATDIPGCREIVHHEQNGLLVAPHDVEALAEALARLLQNPELRKRMGAQGREIAVAEFSQGRVVQETLALYRELLGERFP